MHTKAFETEMRHHVRCCPVQQVNRSAAEQLPTNRHAVPKNVII
jgi:hypothetical protein